MQRDFIFTSDSVTEGHPDKLCDQVSDAIVDRFLTVDPFARINAECAVARGILFLAVQFSARGSIDIHGTARQAMSRIGYAGPGFDAQRCTILGSLTEWPEDVLCCADEREFDEAEIDHVAAGHQATVFGFACAQTRAMMPLPIWLAHKIARRLSTVRLTRMLRYLAPDGKIQVGVEYRDRRPHRVHSIAVLTALADDETRPSVHRLHEDLRGAVIEPCFQDEELRLDGQTAIVVNPENGTTVGGPDVHAGLTGRKTSADTYGEFARQSDAALSGKDPTRIDRIGTYAARHAAKCVVAAGLAEQCEIALCYSMDQSRPVSVQVETYGTARIAEEEILARVLRTFDFRRAAIIARFELRYLPQWNNGHYYGRLACYGQVGRQDMGLPWEVTVEADALLA
jgi:S-adenosylmethionine synthetase